MRRADGSKRPVLERVRGKSNPKKMSVNRKKKRLTNHHHKQGQVIAEGEQKRFRIAGI